MAKQAFKDLADALVPSGGARIADLLRAFDPADPMTKADCDGDKVDLKPLLNDASRHPLHGVLSASADALRWRRHPHEIPEASGVRVCDLVSASGAFGNSADFTLSLIHIPAGSTMPQHGEEVHVVHHVLSGGGDGAQMGKTVDYTNPVRNGQVLAYYPGEPKVIKSGSSPLLLLYARHGPDVTSAKFWFAVNDPEKYKDIYNVKDVYQYYQKFVGDYEEVMRGWGYCVPEVTGDAMEKHVDAKRIPELEVLDLGAGDGLVGKALQVRGFKHMTAVDFSQPMLDLAEKRGCYKKLIRADLQKPLPFEAESFDVLVCTGVTTYITPSVLDGWVTVCRSGGLIAFTHKTSVWPKWEPDQDRLEREGRWEKVWVLDPPLFYLPSLAANDGKEEYFKLYIYRKK